MQNLNSISFLILLFISNTIFISYSQSNVNSRTENTKTNTCECCDLSEEDMVKHFPITCKNDSIILCRKGSMNGMDWTSFLSQNTLYDNYPLYNCQTGKYIAKKKYAASVSATYKNKALIIFSEWDFIAYDTINEKWIASLRIPTYKEQIYAKNSQIQKSEPEFILTPPKLNQKAIDEINTMFENKIKKMSLISDSKLIDYLLISALNGDKKSIERLRNFRAIIPKAPFDDDEDITLSVSLDILNNFEKYKLDNEIEYLDLKQYGK